MTIQQVENQTKMTALDDAEEAAGWNKHLCSRIFDTISRTEYQDAYRGCSDNRHPQFRLNIPPMGIRKNIVKGRPY